jgi:hypothetical protein
MYLNSVVQAWSSVEALLQGEARSWIPSGSVTLGESLCDVVLLSRQDERAGENMTGGDSAVLAT